MIGQSRSDELIQQIKDASGVWSPDQLTKLLEIGRRQRPSDFDSVLKSISIRFEGDQQSVVKQALQKAFPRTGDRMPVDPINWLKFFARNDSGVYSAGVKRSLVDDAGKELPPEDERVIAFNLALDQIQLDVRMPDIERRVNSGARSIFVIMGYQSIDGDNKAVCQTYWPHDVVTINHPSAPDNPSSLWFVAIRQAVNESSSPVWWCWTREVKEDDFGKLTGFGPWSQRRVSEDGKFATPSEQYPGKFPGCFLRIEDPAGGMWPTPDRDISLNVDNLNVARSNRQHVINMQAHAQRIYKGTLRESKELSGGPDDIVQIGSDEDIQSLSNNADHVAIQSSSDRDLQELAVSHGNSPDSFAVTPGAPQSGISRMIANAPHDQKIEEMRPIFKRFEEQQLLPRLIEILELFAIDAPATFSGAKPAVSFNRSKPYEDESAKQQRVLDLRAANLIDDADALVMLGLQDSRQDALGYLESIRGVPGSNPLAGSFFGSAILDREQTEE